MIVAPHQDHALPPRPRRRRAHRLALVALLLAAPALGGATCSNRPDEKTREQAAIHYDLGVQAMNSGDARGALTEYRKAVELDPDFDLAHNALGLIYHVSFDKPDLAVEHYRKALALNPRFSEAYTNLANVYLSQGHWDEAIPLYEKALSDILYKTPYIAENNLAWCLYRKGDVQGAIREIRSALVANPKFCMGHRNLGIIYSETGQPTKALDSWALFARHCPEVAEARQRYGTALLRKQDTAGARREFEACIEKAKDDDAIGDDCRRLLALLDQQQ